MTRILGLDLSLNSTGIAGFTAADHHPWAEHLDTGYLTGHDRIEAILRALADYSADLWVIEGIAYDAHDLNRAGAGLNWIVRHWLWRRRQPYVLVITSTLKKYATGRGDADKQAMLLAAERWFPTAQIADDNEADALWLAHAGYDWAGQPAVRLPAAQRGAIRATVRKKGVTRPVIDWPDLDGQRPVEPAELGRLL
jgi:Holliday junction resolvasome RuvABC endonuclease subunit